MKLGMNIRARRPFMFFMETVQLLEYMRNLNVDLVNCFPSTVHRACNWRWNFNGGTFLRPSYWGLRV